MQLLKRVYHHAFIPTDRILSAISQDGIHWRREAGFRVDVGGIYENQMAYYTFAHRPEDLQGQWEIYYHSSKHTGQKWIGRIIKAISKDGIRWQNDPMPALVDGLTPLNDRQTRAPCLIKIAHTWQMYFTARGEDGILRILCASSPDRQYWVISQEPCIDPRHFHKQDGVTHVSDPSIVWCGGQWRMYFAAYYGNDYHQYIHSAISYDGILWELEEGVRIKAGGIGYRNVVNNPSVIQVGEEWRMYFRGGDLLPLWNNIFMSQSLDAIHWREPIPVLKYQRYSLKERHAVAFPQVVQVEPQLYRMYYTGYWGHLWDRNSINYYLKSGAMENIYLDN